MPVRFVTKYSPPKNIYGNSPKLHLTINQLHMPARFIATAVTVFACITVYAQKEVKKIPPPPPPAPPKVVMVKKFPPPAIVKAKPIPPPPPPAPPKVAALTKFQPPT